MQTPFSPHVPLAGIGEETANQIKTGPPLQDVDAQVTRTGVRRTLKCVSFARADIIRAALPTFAHSARSAVTLSAPGTPRYSAVQLMSSLALHRPLPREPSPRTGGRHGGASDMRAAANRREGELALFVPPALALVFLARPAPPSKKGASASVAGTAGEANILLGIHQSLVHPRPAPQNPKPDT